MKPRISLNAIVDTADHADTIVDVITQALSGKSVFELQSLSRGVDELGRITLNFESRLDTKGDRDSIKDILINRLRDRPQTRDWFLTGTVLTIHSCGHDDDEIKPCYENEFSLEFSK